MAKRKALSRKDKQGLAIICASLLGLVIIALVPIFVSVLKVPYDEETLCPSDREYAHTVILIDKTDPLTATQEDLLRRMINQIKDEMQLYEKLSVYVLDDRNYAFPTPRFALCNPGSGDNASPLYQNPRLIHQRFTEKFGQPLSDALAGIRLGDTRPNSPIMEMIASIAELKDFKPSKERRRLIIFSDMLQHMPEYSQYHAAPDFKTFADTPYARRLSVEMTGVSVRIVYLLRAGSERRQTNAHGLFWEQYFARLGARLDEIRPSR